MGSKDVNSPTLFPSELDIGRVLRRAAEDWDGGWLFAGLLGNGDSFIFRDPTGIRPGFWYEDDDVVAAASERAPLATIFNTSPDNVPAIDPGHALIVRRDGTTSTERCAPERPVRQCTFERLYFSRGNDPDIYEERKELGRKLAKPLLDLVDWNVRQTVYSFVPNTAETAYYGLVAETQRLVRERQIDAIWSKSQSGELTREQLETLSTPPSAIRKSRAQRSAATDLHYTRHRSPRSRRSRLRHHPRHRDRQRHSCRHR